MVVQGMENSWNNVFVFVCDCNEKIVEGFDGFFLLYLDFIKKYLCIFFKTLYNETYHLVAFGETSCWLS